MDKTRTIQEMLKIMQEIARHPRQQQAQMQNKGENALLMILLYRGGSAWSGELAECTGVTTARVAAALKQMEAKGLIQREMDLQDRRRIRVILTDEGQKEALRKKENVESCWSRLFEYLGEEDTDAFLRILGKINGFMDQMTEEDIKCLP